MPCSKGILECHLLDGDTAILPSLQEDAASSLLLLSRHAVEAPQSKESRDECICAGEAKNEM